MKRVFAALLVFVVIIVMSIINANKILTIAEEIQSISNEVEREYKKDNWSGVREKVEAIKRAWEKNHMWAYTTLSTEQIDEIEVSLEQSIAYSDIEAREDFIGEFRMFCMLIEHLPKQEAFSIGELL